MLFTNKLIRFGSFLTVCVCGEPGHSHHRPVPTSTQEAWQKRDTGPGHCCCLLPTGAATCLRGKQQGRYKDGRWERVTVKEKLIT